MKPNQTFRPAKRLDQMRSYKLVALHNFIEWECQVCGTDLWMVEREKGTEWPLDFCSKECSFNSTPLSDELVSAVKRAVDTGGYRVPAIDIADAMLDGVPPKFAVGLRSRQWRERRIAELRAMAKPTVTEVALG